MLTTLEEPRDAPSVAVFPGADDTANTAPVEAVAEPARRGWLARVLRIEWLGQTAASLCWIASVFTYGISSAGDWLQLAAASAWLVANVAAACVSEAD